MKNCLAALLLSRAPLAAGFVPSSRRLFLALAQSPSTLSLAGATSAFDLQTVEKALVEENIMLPMQETLLSPLADSAASHGAAGVSQCVQELQGAGVVRVNDVLDAHTAAAMLQYVNQKKLDTQEECLRQGWVDDVESTWLCRNRFANVLLKRQRWDLLLPLPDCDESARHDESTPANDVLMQALDRMIGARGTIGHIVERCFGLEAELYEFATLFSDPGSDRQNIHPDIPCLSPVPPLLTCFVALQSIDATMGPTTFIPQSNHPHYHAALNDESECGQMLHSIPNKLATLHAGDCCVFDPRTLHAGGANRSARRRCLFVISFRNPTLEDPGAANNPGSLRPELKQQKLTLRDCRDMVAKWKIQSHAN